ncbi:hypothetical protein D3C86_1835980 [compost metagenome]
MRRPIDAGGAEQFQAVIVDRNRNGDGLPLTDPPCQQARQAQMHLASGKRVEEQVPAFAGFQHLGQQARLGGQPGPAFLYR